MAKPPTSVRSIRLPDELWAKLAERAAQAGESVNALVAVSARLAVTAVIHPTDVEFERRFSEKRRDAKEASMVTSAQSAATHVDVPMLERKAFNPQQKTGRKK